MLDKRHLLASGKQDAMALPAGRLQKAGGIILPIAERAAIIRVIPKPILKGTLPWA